jgi:AraC family transcriptional regulator
MPRTMVVRYQEFVDGMGASFVSGALAPRAVLHSHGPAQVSIAFGAAQALSVEEPSGRRSSRVHGPETVAAVESHQPHAGSWGANCEIVTFYASASRLAEEVPQAIRRRALQDGAFQAVPLASEGGRLLRAACAGNLVPSRLFVEELVLRTFSSLMTGAAAWNSARTTGALTPMELRRVVEFIEANLAGQLSLTTLARVLNRSAFHFARTFRQTTGKSPHQFVMGRRLARSRVLIADSSRTLSEIALQTGFCSQAHFSALFSRMFGIAPGRLRRQLTGIGRAACDLRLEFPQHQPREIARI